MESTRGTWNILQSQEVLIKVEAMVKFENHHFSPLCNHHSEKLTLDNWYKIYGEKFDKEQDIYKVLKFLPKYALLISKENKIKQTTP